MNVSPQRKNAEKILKLHWDGQLPVNVPSIAERMGIRLIRDFENTNPYSLVEYFFDKSGRPIVRYAERALRDPSAFRVALAQAIQETSSYRFPQVALTKHIRDAKVTEFANYLLVPRPIGPLHTVDPVDWLARLYLITPRLSMVVCEELFDSPKLYPDHQSRTLDDETKNMVHRMISG